MATKAEKEAAAKAAEAQAEQDAADEAAANWKPTLGAHVMYARSHNGGRVVRSLAIVTGVEDNDTLHLLVCPAGGQPSAESGCKRSTEAGQVNRWLPC